MLKGGGMLSMLNVAAIVAISLRIPPCSRNPACWTASSTWSKRSPNASAPSAPRPWWGLLTTGLSCNQTLSIILTRQLCAQAQHNRREMAMYLENSVVLLSAVLPWSIAFSMCSLTLQQGAVIIPFALYLWMVPLYWPCAPATCISPAPDPSSSFFLQKNITGIKNSSFTS